jgi:hypothetical protein
MEPALVKIMWLPFRRRMIQPLRSKARHASDPETRGSSANRDVQFDSPQGQGQPLLGTNLEAADDRLADVGERLLFSGALAHAAGNGWALGHDHSGFVSLQRDRQFHTLMLARQRRCRHRRVARRYGPWGSRQPCLLVDLAVGDGWTATAPPQMLVPAVASRGLDDHGLHALMGDEAARVDQAGLDVFALEPWIPFEDGVRRIPRRQHPEDMFDGEPPSPHDRLPPEDARSQ